MSRDLSIPDKIRGFIEQLEINGWNIIAIEIEPHDTFVVDATREYDDGYHEMGEWVSIPETDWRTFGVQFEDWDKPLAISPEQWYDI